MTPDQRLLDLMLRHQTYLERYKDGETERFARLLRIVARQFRRIFAEIEPENLGAITRTELRRFINKLSRAQMRVYDEYTANLLNDLRSFMNVERELLSTMFATAATLPNRRTPTLTELWEDAQRETMGATGTTAAAFVGGTATAAVDNVEKEIRRGYADNMTTKTVLNNVLGTAALNYRNGLFRRINNWNRGMVPTVIHHISQFTAYQLSKLFFEQYQWVSIMDSKTSEICIDRNGKLYTYGSGPRPPAHPHCRSSIVPVAESGHYLSSMSWQDWFKTQPEAFQLDAVRNSPLTLDAFARKRSLILTGD